MMNMSLNHLVEHAGIHMSSIGIGTWAIGGPYWTEGDPTGWGGPLDDSDSVAALKLAIDSGLTHIDTADVYGYGRSERLVAQAIDGRREDVVLASKVGFVGTSAPSVYSPENIRFQFEQSLRNLSTDYIDIYYIHHCDFGDNDEYLSAASATFQELKRDGLIRSIGLSGYSASDLIRIADVLRPDFIQSWASIEHPEFITPGEPLADYMINTGIKFVAMMPYGQGRLLGKYSGVAADPEFENGDNRYGNLEFTKDSLDSVEPRIEALRSHFGRTSADLISPALGFLVAHEVVASVVPGFRNRQQVSQLISALAREYGPQDDEVVRRAFPFTERHAHPWEE